MNSKVVETQDISTYRIIEIKSLDSKDENCSKYKELENKLIEINHDELIDSEYGQSVSFLVPNENLNLMIGDITMIDYKRGYITIENKNCRYKFRDITLDLDDEIVK